MLIRTHILLFVFLTHWAFTGHSQSLAGMGSYRNQFFANTGYNHSFGTYGAGWYHKEHDRFLKRDIISILDVNFPVSREFYTRFVFRKGLQTDIWRDSTWRIPFSVIGSSDKVITNLFRIHDFATSFFINPGIYKRRYTLALDLDYTVIWYAAFKRTAADNAVDPQGSNRVRGRFAAGVAGGMNFKRFSYLLRAGYQPRIKVEHHPFALYVLFQAGFNCNFSKRK